MTAGSESGLGQCTGGAADDVLRLTMPHAEEPSGLIDDRHDRTRYPESGGIGVPPAGRIGIMSELTFADKPTLVGDRVILRPVTEDDVDGLIELVHDPEVMRLTGSHPRPIDDEREFLRQWYATRADHDDRLDLAIVDPGTGEYVGEVVLKDLDPDNRSCGFRIALSAARHFGKGYGGEATRMVLAHAFGLGVHRVGLEVYAFNPRARHVYETAGFVHEGTMRDALLWNGVWVDAHVMAALAPDAS